MQIQDFFTQLSHGPLSNLSLSGDGSGTIVDAKQGQMIDHLNNGLMRLYSKFILAEKELILRMIGATTSYYLMPQFSESYKAANPDSTNAVYIIDALNPFQDDLIKILTIFDPNGEELPINNLEKCESVFTPRPNQLQVPHPIADATLSIMYQASHYKLQYGVLSQEIYIPATLNEALISFVAAQVYSNMSGQDNSMKARELMSNFQYLIGETVENDTVNSSSSTTNTKFERNGWV